MITSNEIRNSIASLTDAALGGDWKDGDGSILKVMGRNAVHAREIGRAHV